MCRNHRTYVNFNVNLTETAVSAAYRWTPLNLGCADDFNFPDVLWHTPLSLYWHNDTMVFTNNHTDIHKLAL